MKQSEFILLVETDSYFYHPVFMRNILDYVYHIEVFSSTTHPLLPLKDEPIQHYDLNALLVELQTQKSAVEQALFYHYSRLCSAFQEISKHSISRDHPTDSKTCRNILAL